MYEKVENQSQTTGKVSKGRPLVGVVMQDIAVASTGGNGHTTLYGYGRDMALCMKRLKIKVKQRANLNS